MKKSLGYALLAFAVVGIAAAVASAQKSPDNLMRCTDSRWNDRLQNHCEIKEQTLAAGGTINVDGRENGGISIRGWERNDVLIRAKIQTQAPTQAEADQLGREVRI